jgi:hypothetical protein
MSGAQGPLQRNTTAPRAQQGPAHSRTASAAAESGQLQPEPQKPDDVAKLVSELLERVRPKRNR